MNALGLFVSSWALVAALFTLVTLVKLPGRRRAGEAAPFVARPVLLLRPLDAASPRELLSLAAPHDYPGVVEHVVLSPFRPRGLPATISWLPSDPPTANRKVGHLHYALSVLPPAGRAVLAVDADVAVDRQLLVALVSALDGGAEVVSAAPLPESSGSWASLAVRGLLVHTHHSFAALDAMSAGAKAVCGKALGLGPLGQQLLSGLTEHVGEDLELSRRVHASGGAVVLASGVARVPADPTLSLAAAQARFTRWMQVLKAHRPWLYPTVPLLFAATWPVLSLALLSGGRLEIGMAALLVLARTGLSVRLGSAVGAPPLSSLVFWALGEGLLLSAFCASLGSRRVEWRGRHFELELGGRMRPVAAVAPARARPAR